MCGIAGVFSTRHEPAKVHAAAARMQSALRHRGPDDEGLWQSPDGQAALAHRRLSILDLSNGARQPMTTPDGRFTICFNGEIYNFRELRADLEQAGVVFATSSDTEVVLRLFEQQGAACVNVLRGMFAFGIWDDHTRSGFLARDPLGIKPLYFHRSAGCLVFASELRALTQSQLFASTLSSEAVRRYFETGSVPEPLTLIAEAEMLPAGHSLRWTESRCETQCDWQVQFPAVQDMTATTAVQRTRAALLDSVQHHFVSDVPVGVFLSGGIDSTAILALANATGHHGCSTFSIAVDDAASDESAIARRTAAHFGAKHHEMRLDATVAQGLFSEFLDHLDQPTIDGLNTFTVSSLARQHGMKVVLSGLGGDEVFGGYSSFAKIPKMQRLHRWLRLIPGLAGMLERGKPQHRRLADFVRSRGTVEDAYASLRGIFAKSEAAKLTQWITGQHDLIAEPQASSLKLKAITIADQISELELTRYMRNQLLRDSDVMSMAHGLELRVPFVDRAMLEAVAEIPAALRLQSGKRLLTDAVPEVPEWVVNQKKRGFLFPYQKWLGSDLGETFEAAVRGCSVPTPNWYQRWSIYVLRRAMVTLGISR
jgi:asparagine synthase (glutamine-hydrolysing)